MEGFKAAVTEYKSAKKALDEHLAIYGAWYQWDEPIRASERRAEEKIREERRKMLEQLRAATNLLISEALKFVNDNTTDL